MTISTSMACKLLCASESAYAIGTNDLSGNYNPLDMWDPISKKWIPDPSKEIYRAQFNNVGFKNTFVVVAEIIQAALIGNTGSEIIVAFRGTLAPAENWPSFFDWLQDFWASPISDPNIPEGMVHSGFMNAINALDLDSSLYNAIKSADPTGKLPIYITGHSKGGGIAPIASIYLRTKYKLEITQTITFAGPRPGNADFCTFYDQIYPNDVRFENYLDIVPLLPPTPEFIKVLNTIPFLPDEIRKLLVDGEDWNYSSVGTLMYIAENGTAKQYTRLEADLLAVERIAEIAETMISGNLTAIANAHHASCGFGYMNGTCPLSVCS